MRVKVVAACVVMLLLAFGAQAFAAQTPNLSITATKVSKAPVIDGKLDDEAWLIASQMGSKVVVDLNDPATAIAVYPRVAYMAYDDTNLYLSYVIFSPDANKLETSGFAVTQNDEVEINVQPAEKWYKVSVDAGGQVLVRDGAFDGVKVAMSKEGIRWVVEISIPFVGLNAIPKAGDTWRVGLYGRQVAAGSFWITWNPTYGSFNNPDRYGYLVFGQ